MSKWEMVKLSEVCNIQSGYAFKSKLFSESPHGMPVIRIRDIIKGYPSTYTTEEYLDKYIISSGDILIGMDGQFNVAVWKGSKALLNQRVCKIWPSSRKLVKRYLMSFLPKVLKKIEDGTSYVTVKHLSVKDINNIEIPLPPLETQRKIAKTLDTVSETLAMRKQQLAELDNLIKSTFYDMFGDPVVNEKGWLTTQLGGKLKRLKYGTSSPPDFSESGYCFIRATNIKAGRIVEEDMRYISEAEASKIEKCKLNIGELIIVRSGVNSGDTCVVTGKYENQYAGYDLILTVDETAINPIFLNELLNTRYLKDVVKPLTRRAGQPHINADQVKRLTIIAPPIDSQSRFAKFVEAIEEQKPLIKKSINETQYLFDSLMSRYFD